MGIGRKGGISLGIRRGDLLLNVQEQWILELKGRAETVSSIFLDAALINIVWRCVGWVQRKLDSKRNVRRVGGCGNRVKGSLKLRRRRKTTQSLY